MAQSHTERGAAWLPSNKQILACIGLAQLLVMNIFALWGGLSLLPLLQLDLVDIFRFWSVPQNLSLGVVFWCIAIANVSPTRRSSYVNIARSSALVLLGYGTMLLLAPTAPETIVGLSLISAALIGAGSAGFYVLWEHVLSSFDNDDIVRIALLALVVSSLEFLLIDLLPKEGQPIWFSLLVLCATALLVASVRVRDSVDTPAAEKAGAQVADVCQLKPTPSAGVLKTLKLLRDPLFCVTAIAFAVALTRIIALDGLPTTGTVNTICIICTGLTTAILYIVRFGPLSTLGIFGTYGISDLYRVFFPLVATSLVLLSIIGNSLALGITMLVYVVFSLVSLLMLPTCVEEARKNNMNPLVVYGIFAGCVHFMFAIATALGVQLYSQESFGAATLSVCVLLIFYVLTMTYTTISKRGHRGIPSTDPTASHKGSQTENAPIDETALWCKTIAADRKLTARETDVFILLARGRDVPNIAKQLYVSENTVRSHSKKLYAKLGVHSKQEMLDLIDRAKGGNVSSANDQAIPQA